MYSYRKSLKSDISDELINTYLLRPIAGLIVCSRQRIKTFPAILIYGIEDASIMVYHQNREQAIFVVSRSKQLR